MEKAKAKNLFSRIFWGVIYAILGVAFLCVAGKLIFYAQYGYFSVSGSSMSVTINPDIDIDDYHYDSEGNIVYDSQDAVICKYGQMPERNEIFIIKYPTPKDPKNTLIKRAIAFEGDRVSIFKDENGIFKTRIIYAGTDEVVTLDEEYIDSPERDNHALWSKGAGTSDENSTFVYDDYFYRTYFKTDSVGREYGVKVSVEYEGQNAWFFEIGEDRVFYMGDNRLDSEDSRAKLQKLGRTQDIVGVVKYIIRDCALKENQNMLWWNQFIGEITFIFKEFSKNFVWNL